jgi:hypothetical protein
VKTSNIIAVRCGFNVDRAKNEDLIRRAGNTLAATDGCNLIVTDYRCRSMTAYFGAIRRLNEEAYVASSVARLGVKSGAKIQLKITATDHDHGFSILTILGGTGSNGSVGLVFTSPQACWQLQKGETTTIEFLRKLPVRTPSSAAIPVGLGIEA